MEPEVESRNVPRSRTFLFAFPLLNALFGRCARAVADLFAGAASRGSGR
jgi:hypothetical protein